MPGPTADTTFRQFLSLRTTGGKDQEGEERGGMQEREVTEECGTKGHPLTAAHSVTARPR